MTKEQRLHSEAEARAALVAARLARHKARNLQYRAGAAWAQEIDAEIERRKAAEWAANAWVRAKVAQAQRFAAAAGMGV